MTQAGLFADKAPVQQHDCYMATCPLCGGKIGASVMDSGDIESMADAVRDAKQWKRDGYVVASVSVEVVNASGKFGHVGTCTWRGRRKS
jgi:hypothetical protein